MSRFTITNPIRMDAMYPDAKIGDLFVATHDRHLARRVVLMNDSCGKATFADEFGSSSYAPGTQFGPEWSLQHIGPSWVNIFHPDKLSDALRPASRVAEEMLQALAIRGTTPSFEAAFQAGVRYAQVRGALEINKEMAR